MAKQDLVAWCGPISNELAKVRWAEPTRVLVIPMGIGSTYPCVGSMKGWSVEQHVDCHGSQAFGRLFASLSPPSAGESKSDELLRAFKLALDWRTRTIASFSAGHGLVEPLLRDDPSAWDCVYLADSYYTGAPAVKQGMLAFAQRAVAGEALFIATCSAAGNEQTRACNECILPLVEQLELVRASVVWPGPVQPERVWTRGKACIADFGARVSHGDHARIVAPATMQAWVSPALSRAVPAPGSIRTHRLSPDDSAPWEPRKAASSSAPWYAWAFGVVCAAGLIGAGYLVLRPRKAMRSGGSAVEEGPNWARLRGDVWILPSGETISANNASHAEVARWYLERQGVFTKSTWEASDRFFSDGAIRVSGAAFEVEHWNDEVMGRVQAYISSQLIAPSGCVMIERRTGRTRLPSGLWRERLYIAPQAADVLLATSSTRFWRENELEAAGERMTREDDEPGDPAFLVESRSAMRRRGDYWISPTGELLVVRDPWTSKAPWGQPDIHEGVAERVLLSGAAGLSYDEAARRIYEEGATTTYMKMGAVRVNFGHDLSVYALNTASLRRIQAYLEQLAYPAQDRILLWEDSRGRQVELDAGYLLAARSPSQVWRGPFPVTVLEVSEAPRSYVFLTDCVGWRDGQDIADMKEQQNGLTRRQFLSFVDSAQMREKERELGYERDARRGLTMAADWHVSYHRSTFLGVPCVYFAWSGIEHIFVDPDLWLRRGAREALVLAERKEAPISISTPDVEAMRRVEAYLVAPVSRREFEQELDRLWRFIDPTYGTPQAERQLVRTEARLARPLHDQVKTAWNAITRKRPVPPGVRQDAVEYAEGMLVLRDRIEQLNAIPGVAQAAVRIKKGSAPLRTPEDVLAYARELIAAQRKLGDMRAPVWGEDARRKWL